MPVSAKSLLLITAFALMALHSTGQDDNYDHQQRSGPRQGKDLLDWIGLGTGPDTDPYLAKANSDCLNGDLSECFKSRALSSLDDFFNKPRYDLTESARIIRMPDVQLRQLSQEQYEYSDSPRATDTEWDSLLKFALRKVEKFMKSTAFEINFDNQLTEHGRYSPRFVDEISDEIDIIEDKKDTLFKRKQLKKLFIPLLIILKIFKLKLLLFLPLILGLASFKKLLGFIAVLVPGLIAYFKFCKPDLNASFGQNNYFNKPHYSPAGVGYYPQQGGGHFQHQQHHFREEEYGGGISSPGAFRFSESPAQDIAYSGYSHYRNNENAKDIQAEVQENETSSKRSILPDS